MLRRDFLRVTGAGAALVLVPRTSHAIDVSVDEPIAPVSADLYGHCREHLGAVVYDGVWVGEGSRIANTRGIRQALVDRLKRLPRGPIRWPGGCFADSYDWRDGIGPRTARPRRTNFWAGSIRSSNRGRSNRAMARSARCRAARSSIAFRPRQSPA